MTRYAIKNWSEHQHYKDRSPPWIKLHKRLLTDYEFQRLPIASKALAPMLWLLASQSDDGSVEGDPERLAFELRWPVDDVLAGLPSLIEKRFLLSLEEMLAPRKQSAPPEYRVQSTEKTKTKSPAKPSPTFESPPGLDLEVWNRWEQYRKEIRKPIKPASMLAAQESLAGFGANQAAVVEQSIANGWQGLFDLKTGGTNGKNGSGRASGIAGTIAELTGANRQDARVVEGTAARVD